MTDRKLAQLLAGATPFALPLAKSFRGVTVREGVLLQGPSGFGEFAPFLEYDDSACARWLTSAVEAAYGTWPQAVRDRVPVNAIVPAVSPHDAAAMAYRAYVGDGCTTVKVKVAEAGQSLEDDVARVAAVRSAHWSAGVHHPAIRIDANGAWTVAEAVTAIRELDNASGGLEYVEQPCRTLDELAELRTRISVPIAADESIRTANDPIRAARMGAADIIVVKVPPLAGVQLALEVVRAAGVPVVVSGAMDSSVGLAAGVALAAAVDSLPFACGLGTGALLADDLVDAPVRPRHGSLAVTRTAPDPDRLAAAAERLGAERTSWWLDRLARAWHAGACDKAGSWIS
ncbi:MAG: o-succinylbenzoate synthase [Candidatus Nanopelagicales bacterium]